MVMEDLIGSKHNLEIFGEGESEDSWIVGQKVKIACIYLGLSIPWIWCDWIYTHTLPIRVNKTLLKITEPSTTWCGVYPTNWPQLDGHRQSSLCWPRGATCFILSMLHWIGLEDLPRVGNAHSNTNVTEILKKKKLSIMRLGNTLSIDMVVSLLIIFISIYWFGPNMGNKNPSFMKADRRETLTINISLQKAHIQMSFFFFFWIKIGFVHSH